MISRALTTMRRRMMCLKVRHKKGVCLKEVIFTMNNLVPLPLFRNVFVTAIEPDVAFGD